VSAVVLSTTSPDLTRKVRIATDDDLLVLRPEQVPPGPAQLLALTPDQDRVRIVLIDVRAADGLVDRALGLASAFAQQYPQIGVVLVADAPEQISLRALRAGVMDVLDPDVNVLDLKWLLRRSMEAARVRVPTDSVAPEPAGGRVITVASPKGGVGKTTVATNIARALVELSPQGTVLVDLDLQFGDVAAALDLETTYSIADIVAGPTLSDPIAMKALLGHHESGLHVVSGVRSPAEADQLTVDRISALIHLLKQEFRYVVLDTAPGMTEHTLAALDHTSDLVLVTTPDVPGIRGLRKELEVLDQLTLPSHNRHIVVNLVDGAGGLTVADVEATIGAKVDAVVPRTPKVARSTNLGTPIVQLAPRDKAARALASLIDRFAPSRGQRRVLRRGRGAS
jgi:pilus assembly protein CpaE